MKKKGERKTKIEQASNSHDCLSKRYETLSRLDKPFKLVIRLVDAIEVS